MKLDAAAMARLAAWEQRNDLRREARIPPRYWEIGSRCMKGENDAQKQAISAAEYWYWEAGRHKGALILSGPPGTGKTHIAAWIAENTQIYREPESSVLFTTMRDAVRTVRATWSRDAVRSEAEAITWLVERPLLVIDDLSHTNSETDRQIVDELICAAYARGPELELIVTTNLDAPSLKNALGVRAFDRLRDNSTWVPVAGESLRTPAPVQYMPEEVDTQ